MIYDYRCKECKHITTAQRPMANRLDSCPCESCGGETFLKVSGGTGFGQVMGASNFPGYMCPVTDQWVDSKRKRDSIMKEHDIRPADSADHVRHHTGF